MGRHRSYNIFRWYRSGWGRYTQADFIGLNGGTNLYSYVHDNPIVLIDRDGLKAEIVCTHIGVSGIPWTPAVHCRLRVTCEKCEGGKFGGPYDTSVGLERNRSTGQLGVDDHPIPDSYGSHYPVPGIDQNDSCQFARCVRANAAGLQPRAPGWQSQYSLFGPNSNTFVSQLITTCGGFNFGGPLGAVGWNSPFFQ